MGGAGRRSRRRRGWCPWRADRSVAAARGNRARRDGHRLSRRARRRRIHAARRAEAPAPGIDSDVHSGASSRSGRSWPTSTTRISPGCSTAAYRRRARRTSSWSTSRGVPIDRYCDEHGSRARSGCALPPRSAGPWSSRIATWSCTATSSRRTSWSTADGAREAARLRDRQAARPESATAAPARRDAAPRVTPDYAEPGAVRGTPRHDRDRRLLSSGCSSTSC